MLDTAESHLQIHVWEYRAGDFELVCCCGESNGDTCCSHSELTGKTAIELLNGKTDIFHDLLSCHKDRTTFKVERTLPKSIGSDGSPCPVTFAFIPTDTVLMISGRSDNGRDSSNPEQFRSALRRKDIALRQVLNHIEEERENVIRDFQESISCIVLPMLDKLKNRLGDDLRREVELIEDSLTDATSGFIRVIQSESSEISPREFQICNMIRKGLISKEIASSLCISVQTVEKNRQQIRRKLGLQNTGISLVKYLNSRFNGK